MLCKDGHFNKKNYHCNSLGHEVAKLLEALRYKPEGRGFDALLRHLSFSLTKTFRPQYGPGVDSASNANE